jgi:hypothetical protein
MASVCPRYIIRSGLVIVVPHGAEDWHQILAAHWHDFYHIKEMGDELDCRPRQSKILGWLRVDEIMAASLCLRDVAFPELFRKNAAP